MMNRRRFLGAVLATFTPPAIVRADSLMRVRAIEQSGFIYSSGRICADISIITSAFADEGLERALMAIARCAHPREALLSIKPTKVLMNAEDWLAWSRRYRDAA